MSTAPTVITYLRHTLMNSLMVGWWSLDKMTMQSQVHRHNRTHAYALNKCWITDMNLGLRTAILPSLPAALLGGPKRDASDWAGLFSSLKVKTCILNNVNFSERLSKGFRVSQPLKYIHGRMQHKYRVTVFSKWDNLGKWALSRAMPHIHVRNVIILFVTKDLAPPSKGAKHVKTRVLESREK